MPRGLKIFFLLISAAALTVGLLWAGQPEEWLPVRPERWETDLEALRQDFGEAPLATKGLVTMTAPTFTGRDTAGRQWQLTAAQALQAAEMEVGTAAVASTVRLARPQVKMTTAAGQSWLLQAGQAAYTPANQQLQLTQGVALELAALSVTLATLDYDLDTQQGQGGGGVLISAPWGTLQAPRLAIVAGGDTLRLSGGVTARLKQQR